MTAPPFYLILTSCSAFVVSLVGGQSAMGWESGAGMQGHFSGPADIPLLMILRPTTMRAKEMPSATGTNTAVA